MAIGLLCGLANCRDDIRDGTGLAYAGPDVTKDLACSVRGILAKADLTLTDEMLEDPPHDETTPESERNPLSTRRFAHRPDCHREDSGQRIGGR
jgi:hypothetical protein